MEKELKILRKWIKEQENLPILLPIKNILLRLIENKIIDVNIVTKDYSEYLIMIGASIDEDEQYTVSCWCDFLIIDLIEKAIDLELYEVAENLKNFSKDYWKNYY
jgi:hypothetical protein